MLVERGLTRGASSRLSLVAAKDSTSSSSLQQWGHRCSRLQDRGQVRKGHPKWNMVVPTSWGFPPWTFGGGGMSHLGGSMNGLNQSFPVQTSLHVHMKAGACVGASDPWNSVAKSQIIPSFQAEKPPCSRNTSINSINNEMPALSTGSPEMLPEKGAIVDQNVCSLQDSWIRKARLTCSHLPLTGMVGGCGGRVGGAFRKQQRVKAQVCHL